MIVGYAEGTECHLLPIGRVVLPLNIRRGVSGLAAAVLAAVLVPVAASPAFAAGSSYGEWTASSLTVPAVGFPAATVTTTSTSEIIAAGTSTYLGDSTPFGAAYGSSRGHNYIALRTASGLQPSVTTLDFASPTPVGWGFTLGDVDADHVKVEATGADGSALTAAQLGWQGTFNYCQASPKPAGCTGSGPFTDLPHWDAATTTLVGSNTGDTSGASGWLRPTVPVKSLKLTFSVQSGIPIYQIWVATKTADITGRITSACGSPGRTLVSLLDSKGDPVLDQGGRPITAMSRPDGRYGFSDVAQGSYRVAVRVPDGFTADSTSVAADATDGDATDVNVNLNCAPIVEPITPPPSNDDVPDLRIRVPIIDTVTLPVVITEPPANGTVTTDPKNPAVLVYKPNPGFSGTDSFVYGGKNKKTGKQMFVKVTVKVPKRPVHPPRPRPSLAATGANGDGLGLVLALSLTGAGALVLAGARTARRRR